MLTTAVTTAVKTVGQLRQIALSCGKAIFRTSLTTSEVNIFFAEQSNLPLSSRYKICKSFATVSLLAEADRSCLPTVQGMQTNCSMVATIFDLTRTC